MGADEVSRNCISLSLVSWVPQVQDLLLWMHCCGFFAPRFSVMVFFVQLLMAWKCIYLTGTPTDISPVRPLPTKPSITTPGQQTPLITLLGRSKEEETSALANRRAALGINENPMREKSPPPVTSLASGSALASSLLDLNKRMGLVGGAERPPTSGGLSQQFGGSLGGNLYS